MTKKRGLFCVVAIDTNINTIYSTEIQQKTNTSRHLSFEGEVEFLSLMEVFQRLTTILSILAWNQLFEMMSII